MPFLENRALIVFLCSQQAFCAIASVLTFFAESSASAQWIIAPNLYRQVCIQFQDDAQKCTAAQSLPAMRQKSAKLCLCVSSGEVNKTLSFSLNSCMSLQTFTCHVFVSVYGLCFCIYQISVSAARQFMLCSACACFMLCTLKISHEKGC